MNEKKENAFLKLWHNTNGKIGLLLLLSITLLALLAPVLTEYDPLAMGVGPRLEAPSAQHWMGTDEYGRDTFSRILDVYKRQDTFRVGETGEIRVAGMPFLTSSPALGQEEAAANASRGSSYNAQLSLGGVIPVKTVRAEVLGRRVVQVCGTPFGIKMFANGAMVVGFSDIYTCLLYTSRCV